MTRLPNRHLITIALTLAVLAVAFIAWGITAGKDPSTGDGPQGTRSVPVVVGPGSTDPAGGDEPSALAVPEPYTGMASAPVSERELLEAHRRIVDFVEVFTNIRRDQHLPAAAEHLRALAADNAWPRLAERMDTYLPPEGHTRRTQVTTTTWFSIGPDSVVLLVSVTSTLSDERGTEASREDTRIAASAEQTPTGEWRITQVTW